MKITFSGGAYEIGASCILLRIDDKNILLDCGIRQNQSKDTLPDLRIIQELGGVDAIIASHAHLDHTGALPIISNEYPNARIYMNYMTKDLVRVLLYDSLKIMNNREGEIPKFAEVHVKNMLERVFVINPEAEFQIFKGITVTLYAAGHIAGASSVYIKANEGAFFYSGDFSIFSQNTVEGARIPKLRPDAAIFESTYGDKLHANREIEEERLLNLISDCTSRGGKALVPAFALGRAQEVILILKWAINRGRINKVKIYVDGMVKDINRVYKLHPTYLRNNIGKKILKGTDPFYDENVIPVGNQEERDKIITDKESPCVIISSSGMLTGGPSQFYAEKLCMDENNSIILTGYQDEESPGRKLLELLENEGPDRFLEVEGRKIPVRCSIEKVGLSAHGDKGEIKALVQSMTPRNIFLVHGEGSVIEGLAKELAREVRVPVFVPKSGETFEIDIRNPRKQLERKLDFKMHMKKPLDGENIQELWEFVSDNYGGRYFTCEDLLYIWKGDKLFSSEELDELKDVLIDSVYFETDNRRLFLHKAKERCAVEEELKPKELKQNEISELAAEYFGQYGFQKAGLMVDEKKVILYFDFPKAVDESIEERIREFTDKTSWEVSVYEQTNLNAAEQVLRGLLVDADIKKISFYAMEGKFKVILNSSYKVKDEPSSFKEVTGLDLEVQKSGETGPAQNTGVIKTGSKDLMEQNSALKCIDEYFEVKDDKPYKKSIKSSPDGKYIELAFISPIIGNKYIEDLKHISEIIGWDMAVSSSVNQNEIINIAAGLCRSAGVNLVKNPSFNPADLSIILRVKEDEDEIFDEMKEHFERLTGCTLKFQEI